MAINIKYRPLKAFLLAVDTGSFTHAANHLGVTQPSFTALIQDLEEVLGLRLFERTTRSISLTSAGQDFYARVQRPIADLEEAYRSLADLAAVRRGNVALGALPSAALTLLPAATGTLRQAHPALKVRVVEAHNDELVALLRTNQNSTAPCAMRSGLRPPRCATTSRTWARRPAWCARGSASVCCRGWRCRN